MPTHPPLPQRTDDTVSSATPSSPTAWGKAIGRLAGCLWLFVAGFGLLFIAGAAGVGIDASFVLLPLVVAPLALAIIVFVGGSRVPVLVLSAAAGIAFAGLGALNYLQSAAFEQANAGTDEISGGGTSVIFVLLSLAIAAWSIGAAGLIRREGRG